MNIAKDFYVGKTHIKIATDYCDDKTPGDVKHTLEKIARTSLQHFRAAAEREAHGKDNEI